MGTNNHSVSNAYATGNVSGSDFVGGLVGLNSSGSISSAYATGNVSGVTRVGGLVGFNHQSSSISNAYWDSTTTGPSPGVGTDIGVSTNISAVTSSTAYNHSSYTNLGTWTETASGSGVWVARDGSGNKQWVMMEGATRPFLYSEYSANVRNAHQLQLMAYDLTASYTLSTNIDASETNGSNASGMWTNSGFSPVGNSTEAFSGSLDGQSHTITDLTINRSSSDFVGLFGIASSTSAISNLGLVGGSVSGVSEVGALVGYNVGSISNAYATGSVSGSGNDVGGLVGDNDGSIRNAYAAGSVSGGYVVGGLVGVNYAGNISDAYATGNVSGENFVGGLVGASQSGTAISNAYATGSVSGNYVVGGLVGSNGGSLSNVYATGTVAGAGSVVGGLVGDNDGSISEAYASGSVSGLNHIGGLVGDNTGGSISSAYASGGVAGSGSKVGALVGHNEAGGTVTTSFWRNSVSTTGIGVQDGSIDSFTRGLSAREANSASTYSDAGWNLATVGGSSSVWRIYDGYTMPLLRSFLTALTVTTSDASKVYDGTTSLSSSYTLSDSNANTNLILGTASCSTSSPNVGSYSIDTSGLYSSQQGYDISYVNGTATITAATATTTDNTQLSEVQQSQQTTPQGTTPTSALALAAATSRELNVQSCGMRLPDGMACQ